MAGILDNLVTHLERRILSGDSRERISAEIFNEFMNDFASAAPQTTVTPQQEVPKKETEVKSVEAPPVQSSMGAVENKAEVQSAALVTKPEVKPEFTPVYSEKPKPLEIQKNTEGLSLAELRTHGNSCSACSFKLGENRSQSTGLNSSARLMIITEPSGRTEEHMLDPFHDEAGALLLKMISAMKIDMDELYICMAHKCFGPGARDKIVETRPFLEKQIELVKPEIILIFGGAALNILLGEQSLMKNRGKWLEIKNVPAIATYPPAYLQQKNEAKREAWNDMQQVMARLQL